MTSKRAHISALGLGLAAALLLLFAPGGAPPVAHASTTYTVNDAGDAADFVTDTVCETATGNGICTLRAAIQESNAAAGTYFINFAIPATGSIKTISPATYLPVLLSDIHIDGTTQTGGGVGIELSGLSCTTPTPCPWGLAIAYPSSITGMVVNDFASGAGIAIGPGGDGSFVTNSYIGTNTGASAAKSNIVGVIVAGSSSNTISGNTISGNTAYGLWITSCSPPPGSGCLVANNNSVSDNRIGTNSTFTSAIPNGIGVYVDATPTYGTPAAVTGNRIGVFGGLYNTIAGNTGAGVQISGSLATANTVESSYVGHNGTGAIANGGVGVCICGASSNVIGPGDVIAGNTLAGVLIKESGGVGATGNSVQNGTVGVNAAATSALANGGSGIEIDGSGTQAVTGNTVGCAIVGCGITIAGNTGNGVYIHGAMASANAVAHAAIGERCLAECVASAIPIPNLGHGVYISGGAHHNVVGGSSYLSLTGNDIAYNHGAGFAVDGGGAANEILGTTVHDNDGLGIDVDPIAPIGTTQDVPSFAPYLTAPYEAALTSALYCPLCASGGMVAITGYAHGAPPGVYHVDVYFDLTCDPSGYGEGARPIIATWYAPANAVTADANGNLSGAGIFKDFTATAGIASLSASVGKYMTSNATLISPTTGATGEYGKCLLVKADTDSDGLEDSIDPSGVSSDCFSDIPSGGTTFGCIVSRAGCYVSVVDLPNPDGVVIGNVCAPSGGGPATVSVCGIATIEVIDGSSLLDTCDSFRSGILVGPINMTIGDVPYTYPATLPTNTRSVVAQLVGLGRYGVVNDPTSATAIIAGGHSIAPGDDYTLAPPVGGLSEPPNVAALTPATEAPARRESESMFVVGAVLGLLFLVGVGAVTLGQRGRAR